MPWDSERTDIMVDGQKIFKEDKGKLFEMFQRDSMRSNRKQSHHQTFEFGNWHVDSELQTVSVKKMTGAFAT